MLTRRTAEVWWRRGRRRRRKRKREGRAILGYFGKGMGGGKDYEVCGNGNGNGNGRTGGDREIVTYGCIWCLLRMS